MIIKHTVREILHIYMQDTGAYIHIVLESSLRPWVNRDVHRTIAHQSSFENVILKKMIHNFLAIYIQVTVPLACTHVYITHITTL